MKKISSKNNEDTSNVNDSFNINIIKNNEWGFTDRSIIPDSKLYINLPKIHNRAESLGVNI